MAALKKIATAGLIMALAVPTVVYGADKAGYSQPIAVHERGLPEAPIDFCSQKSVAGSSL